MATPKTSAEQYAPVPDAEGYLDTKGGVPTGEAASQGETGKSPRRLESPVEAERHAAEVGNEQKKQRHHGAK